MAEQARSPSLWRMLVVVGVAVLIAGVLFAWSRSLFPLLAGFLLAYLTHPLASFFERHHMPRILAFLVILLLFVGVVTLIFFVFVPALLNELVTIGEKLPSWQDVMQERVTPVLSKIKARFPQAYVLLEDRLNTWAQTTVPSMADRLVNRIGQVLGSFLSVASALVNLVLIPVIAAYLTVDFSHFISSLRRLVPRPVLPTVDLVVGDVHAVLSSFVRGQLLVSLALTVMYTGGLLLVRAPLALVVGPLAGILSLVPYLGLVVGVASAFFLSFFQYQDLMHPLATLGVFLVAQSVEGWVLTPSLLGRSVGLHPVWVLVSLLIGGELFGVPGIIVAVPVAAALRVVLKHAIRAYRASEFYQGEGPMMVVYVTGDSPQCQEFRDMVEAYAAEWNVAVRVVDVASSARLRKSFGQRVPLLEVNGEIVTEGEVWPEKLHAVLHEVIGGGE
ncbi:MAG TPA: AI-2E family transporter [Thermoanaerobaculaceae bacterium]|nr:AI-2E family transporter [Thermoanaerobaculaceae bacterium]